MPSLDHDALIELIRSDPSLLRTLLASLGVEIAGGEAEVCDATLTAPELRADLVVAFGNQQSPDVVLIAEIQLSADADKRYSMPFYAMSARSRYRCPAIVVVIAIDEAVAAWARKPVQLDPYNAWRPLVIGPSDVPRVTDVAEALARPHLAVLSARMHAKGPDGVAIARAALQVLPTLPDDRDVVYLDVIWSALDAAARLALEGELNFANYVPTNPFYYQALEKGLTKGREEGIAKGREEGIAKGREEGIAQGIAQGIEKGIEKGREEGLERGIEAGRGEGERDALRVILRTRGLSPTAAQDARIEACGDVAVLRQRVARAVTALSVDEVLAD